MDNQIRYANKISISLKLNDSKKCYLNSGMTVQILNQILWILYLISLTKEYKGEFGLGLVIVYKIINLHGGKVWAKNEEKGVSFQIEIPNLKNSL